MLTGLLRSIGWLYLHLALGKDFEKKQVSIGTCCLFTIIIIMWLMVVLFAFESPSVGGIVASVVGLIFFVAGLFFMRHIIPDKTSDDSTHSA